MKITYEQAKCDFLTLCEIVDVDDVVEIDANMAELMANPTKKFALELYKSSIGLWFGQERGNDHTDDVAAIGERHGESLSH